jgi:hypothetical protein
MAKKWKVKHSKGVKFEGGPCFIVKKDDVYYLTVGVLVYDKNDTDGDTEKEKGVAEIECFFNNGGTGANLEIVELNTGGTLPGKCVPKGKGAMAAGADAGRLGGAAASAPQGGQGGGGGGGQPGQPGQPGEPPHPPHPPPGPGPAPPPQEPPGVQTEPPGVQTGP